MMQRFCSAAKNMRLAVVALFALALFGCQRNDMWYQAKYRTYSESDFFADGQTARPLPKGTVPRGHLEENDLLYRGLDNGKPTKVFPFQITKEVLARGKDRFNVFCAPCHARSGNGLGMIVQRGFPQPESFHIDRLRSASPGYFYGVLMDGYGKTNNVKVQNADGTTSIQEDYVHPAIATKSTAEDRWAIIAYIRALQRSQNAAPADVPPDKASKLNEAGK